MNRTGSSGNPILFCVIFSERIYTVRSGSGKSTLFYILGGLDTPTSGAVFMNGTDISQFNDEKMSRIRRRNIGFVFQFYNLIPNLNAEENIMLPLL